ncbi:protein kinase domain-containing protein [Cryptosporidium muris RN66]|uniref:non-specific serine/threonine protein kinase n=1 Tax=Cryptosporidium muris (strain RN66) TaxID=441375 RepID=B6AI59_CRYMR|nr:protein kinase domain-containing protein [Cryptosporidium muris RN66]EEA07900.1 protein kinase domain-containing protein [Cryptosporidium muris RN66]|eukprot:XP_002142249.1 protein kinase domain-containing protein [Cryptosporidium muris RN66]
MKSTVNISSIQNIDYTDSTKHTHGSLSYNLVKGMNSNSNILQDYDEATIPANSWDEVQEDYRPGGYHPVYVGEIYNTKYLIVSKLGWGHFSTVWLAVNLSSKPLHYVALKFQKGAPEYKEAAYDEINILTVIRKNKENEEWNSNLETIYEIYKEEYLKPKSSNFTGVVDYIDSFEVSGPNGHHVCMVFEVMGPNILHLVSLYKYKGIPIDLVRKIAVHILIGLDYLHRICGVIHTDIKPENIVVSSDSLPMIPINEVNKEDPELYLVNTENNRPGEQFEMSRPMNAKERRKLRRKNRRKLKQIMKNSKDNCSINCQGNEIYFADSGADKTENLKGQSVLSEESKEISEKGLQNKLDYNRRLATPPFIRLHLKPMPSDPTCISYYQIKYNATVGRNFNNQVYSDQMDISDILTSTTQFPMIQRPYHYHLYEAYHPHQYIGEDEQRYTHLLPLSQWNKQYIETDNDFNGYGKENISINSCKTLDQKTIKYKGFMEYIGNLIRESSNNPNLFSSNTSEYRIVDLGNSCWINKHFSDDIQTRQYRSPEVIVGSGYDNTADIWSFGCTIFELLTGDLLFTPKSTAHFSCDDDHLAQMIELLGDFPTSLITKGKKSKKFFTKHHKLQRITKLQFWDLESVLVNKYRIPKPEAHNFSLFLLPFLSLDPCSRPKAYDMLNHPWLKLRGMSTDYLENMLAKVERPLQFTIEDTVIRDIQQLHIGDKEELTNNRPISIQQELADWFISFKQNLNKISN